MAADHGTLDEDQLELRKVTAAIARERYAPKAAEWDAARTTFPKEERRFLGDQGLLGIACRKSTGGRRAAPHGAGRDRGTGQGVPPGRLPGVRGEHRPGPGRPCSAPKNCSSGSCRAFSGATTWLAISEPDAGSAATDMTTRAKFADGHYTVNGAQALDLQRQRGRRLPGLRPAERRARRQGHRRPDRGGRPPGRQLRRAGSG